MKLISLTLQNFKGIKGLSLMRMDRTAMYSGTTERGRARSLMLLHGFFSGKNSRDEKDFGIKTLDANGTLSLGLNIVFPLSLNITDKSSSLLGHTKNAGANSVAPPRLSWSGIRLNTPTAPVGAATPINASEYARVINNLIDEKIFKLITDPLYFNERLSWQERRQAFDANLW